MCSPLEPLAPACGEYSWPPEVIMVRFERPITAALAVRMQADAGGEGVTDDERSWGRPSRGGRRPNLPTGAAGRCVR